MKKKEHHLIFILTALCFVYFTSLKAQLTQIIDLSTGVNSSGAQLPPGSIDPKWTVMVPGTSYFQNTKANDVHYWTNFANVPSMNCGRWISHEYLGSNPYPTIAPQGLYQYRMSFAKNSNCNVVSAKIVFNYTCADNELLYFKLNSSFTFNYPAPGFPTSSNYLPSQNPSSLFPRNHVYSISLNPGDIINGTNTIDFYSYNYNNYNNTPTMTGLALCAYLEIQYEAALTSSISGPSSFCFGNPITLNGNIGMGTTANTHQWTLVECDATGSTIYPATFWASPSYNGNPGSFTFPNNIPSLQCGKYFRIQLTASNNCSTHTSTKIIQVKCKPAVRFVRSQTICKGSCITLWAGYNSSFNYSWGQLGGDEPIYLGNTSSIVVCPQATTSYVMTLTDPATGCSTIYYVTITVEDANPNFSTSVSTINSSYITVAATPNQITNLPANLGYAWTVYELDAASNVIWSVGNPSCWWTFPGTITNNFSGLNGLTQTFDGTTCLPSVGQFKYNTPYQIVRGTWSDACPYTQVYQTIYYGQRGLVVIDEGDKNKDEAMQLIQREMSNLTVPPSPLNISLSPTPTKGILKITHSFQQQSLCKVVITDLTGRLIMEHELSSGKTSETIDIGKHENGIYFANFYKENTLIKTEKIVLNK